MTPTSHINFPPTADLYNSLVDSYNTVKNLVSTQDEYIVLLKSGIQSRDELITLLQAEIAALKPTAIILPFPAKENPTDERSS